jgi:hypothetical protein
MQINKIPLREILNEALYAELHEKQFVLMSS